MENDRDDSELADLAAARRIVTGAMTAMIDGHFDYVYAVCTSGSSTEEASAEAHVEETLIKAANHIKSFGHKSTFRTWLH